jgi:hypothetical protein
MKILEEWRSLEKDKTQIIWWTPSLETLLVGDVIVISQGVVGISYWDVKLAELTHLGIRITASFIFAMKNLRMALKK